MEFELQHRKELLILIDRAASSCRENIREIMSNQMEQYFTEFFTASILVCYYEGGYLYLIRQYKDRL